MNESFLYFLLLGVLVLLCAYSYDRGNYVLVIVYGVCVVMWICFGVGVVGLVI